MNITADTVKQLRERTGAGMMECKKALVETKGDLDAAAELMRKSGLAKADKKAARIAAEGTVVAERAGNSAVLVEVNCETDFVARSEDFCKFTRDVAIHIAALNPKYIKKEDVPADVLAREADKEAYIKANCLLAQAYVKDPSKNIQDLLNELVAKIGENIVVGRFVRYKVGE